MDRPVLLLLLLVALLPFSCGGDPARDAGSCCSTNQMSGIRVTRCLRHGDKFIKKYMRSIRKETQRKATRVCKMFDHFRTCVKRAENSCPGVMDSLDADWKMVINMLNCSCTTGTNVTTGCTRHVNCFEETQKGFLAKTCRDYKRERDLEQRQICHFVAEETFCNSRQVALVCGKTAAKFAYHVTRLFMKRHANRNRCHTPHTVHHPVQFLPRSHCGATFANEMRHCEERHLPSFLEFMPENGLVVRGSVSTLKNACRQYKSYERCVRPIREKCEEGVNHVMSYDGQLRTYLQIMKLLCRQMLNEYTQNLPCYQRIVRNKTTQQCNDIWRRIRPLLDNVTSHQLYCDSQHPVAVTIKRELDRLRHCITEGVVRECGPTGGAIFDKLTADAFQDPYYLRYGSKPTCFNAHAGSQDDQSHGVRSLTNRAAVSRVFVPSDVENTDPKYANLVTTTIKPSPTRSDIIKYERVTEASTSDSCIKKHDLLTLTGLTFLTLRCRLVT